MKIVKWFKSGLAEVKELNIGPIAVSHKIGCGLAGGDWKEYKQALKNS